MASARGTQRSPTPDQSSASETPLRFVSAASLFDGHDAAINIIRRILQSHGAEVIHLLYYRAIRSRMAR